MFSFSASLNTHKKGTLQILGRRAGKPLRERPERPSQPKDKDKDKYQCSVNVGGSGGGGMAMVDLVQWREDEDGVVLGGSGDDDCEGCKEKEAHHLLFFFVP